MINEAPGPVVETMPTLLEAIKEYDFNLYNEKYKAFSKKYNHADDGNASGKVIELLTKIVPYHN